jgi:hypothetical protein
MTRYREYGIYCIINGGCPYVLKHYRTLEFAKIENFKNCWHLFLFII